MTWTLQVDLADVGVKPEKGVPVKVAPAVSLPLVADGRVLIDSARAMTLGDGTVAVTVASIPGMVWKITVAHTIVVRIPDPGPDTTVTLANRITPAGPLAVDATAALMARIDRIEQAGGTPINLTETEPGIWQIGALA